MPDERTRAEVIQFMSEKAGPELAAALMECVPPFAWTELATKTDLRALEARIDLRFEVMETKFDALESKFVAFTSQVDGRVDALGAKFDALEAKFVAFTSKVDGRLEGFEGRLEGFQGQMTALIEAKLSMQNRTLVWAAAAAIVASVVANIFG